MTTPLLDSAGSVSLDSQRHRGFIVDHGMQMLHTVGLRCTCIVDDPLATTLESGKYVATDPWCARCQNERFVYRDPMMMTGLVTNISQRMTPAELGWANAGDMVFAPAALSGLNGVTPRVISQWDCLTATWPQPLDGGQVLVRGVANFAENLGRYALRENEDALWYEPVPSGALWCENERIGDDGKPIQYQPGDFEFGPGKKIAWVSAHRPAEGDRYVVKYQGFIEWIVKTPPVERWDGGANLGQRVLLEKRHVRKLNAKVDKVAQQGAVPLQAEGLV